MRSGEIARLTDVSSDTLRHYERLGLLPNPPRTAGGYRDYDSTSLERVRLIQRALSVGFSLSELKTILKMRDHGEPPCLRVRAMTEAKLEQVKQRIRDLIEMREQLGELLKNWDVKLARTRKGQPARLLEELPQEFPRRVVARTSLKNKHRKEERL